MLTMFALAAAASAAQPEPPRTFRNWVMGCDNVHSCQALALPPEGYQEDPEAYLMLTLTRGARTNDPLRLSWDNEEEEPATLAVDGRVIERRATIGMALTPAMVDALKAGAAVSLTWSSGVQRSASLSGVSAALLAIDDVQGRVDTPTAAVRRGTRVMRATVPALPFIVRPAPSAAPPRTITADQAEAIIGPDNARCSYATAPVRPAAWRLDTRHSLVLIDHVCGNGAYNFLSTAMIIDETGRVTPARFETDPGMGPEGPPGNVIVNAGFMPENGMLEAYAKGRGIGDCGWSATYVWDGSRFALANQAMMPECRLRMGFISIWSTEVREAPAR